MLKYVLLHINQSINQRQMHDLCLRLRGEGIETQRMDDEGVQSVTECLLITDENNFIQSTPGNAETEAETKAKKEMTEEVAMKKNTGRNGSRKYQVNLPIVGVGLDYTGDASYIVEDLSAIDAQYLRMVYARFYKKPCVIAQTERLLIREMTMQDIDELYELYETLRDCDFVERLYERKEEEEFTSEYIKNMYGFYGYGLWLVFRKEDNQLIGRAGIENREIDGKNVQELGYLIGRPWQKQHYAQEVCEKIIEYAAEELEIDQLFVCTDEKNNPSILLAQKLGFTFYADSMNGMNIYYKLL